MKHLRFVLHNTLFYFATILAFFIVEASTASFNKPSYGLSTPFFFVFSILTIILMFFYYIIDGKKNGISFKWIIFLVLLILYATLIFSTLYVKDQTFVDAYNNEHSVHFTMLDKVKYCFEITLLFLVLYGFFALYLNKKFSTKVMHWIFSIYVVFVFVSVISSLFIDFKIYKDIFTIFEPTSGVKSFYVNENIYGMAILIGILSLFILNVYKPHWYNFILIFLLFVANIFSTCVTTILLSLVSMIVYFIYESIYLMKKKLVFGLIFLSILLLSIFAIIVTYRILLINEVKWMVNFDKFLFNHLLNKDVKTLSSRTVIWSRIFKEILLTNPLYLIFGTGYKTSTILLKNMMTVGENLTEINSAHNGYVEIMLQSGIVGISIYALFLILLVVISIKLMIKKRFRFAFIYDICIAVLLGHGIAESTVLFGLDTQNFLIGVLFVSPLFIEYRNCYKKEKVESFINNEEIQHVNLDKLKLKSLMTSILFGLFLCSFSLLISNNVNTLIKPRTIVILIGTVLLISSLFLPNILFSLSNKTISKKKLVFKLISVLLIIFVPIALISYVLVANDSLINHSIYIVPLFTFVILLVTNFIFTATYSSFKEWMLSIFKGLRISGSGLLALFLTLILSYALLPNFVTVTPYLLGIIVFINFFVYCFIVGISHIKFMKSVISNINDKLIYDYKLSIREYFKTYNL